jgi:chromosome segregation ATPase
MEENMNTVDTAQTPEIAPAPDIKPEPKPEPPKADNAEVERLKQALSRANSEAANYKRQLREKQSEAERADAERAEEDRALREELEELRKEKDTGDSINRALALKVEDETARKLAKAWQERDKTALFDSISEIIQATITRLNNEALNRHPALSAGTPPTKASVGDELDAQLWRYAGLSPRR